MQYCKFIPIIILIYFSLCLPLQIWEDFIVRIDEKVGARVLLDLLIEKIARDDVSEEVKEYAAAWVVLLTDALQGRCEGVLLRRLGGRPHGLGPADVERWLSGSCCCPPGSCSPPGSCGPPGRLLLQLLPCLCQLAGVEAKKVAQLRALLTIAVGDTVQVFTIQYGTLTTGTKDTNDTGTYHSFFKKVRPSVANP